MIIDGGLGESGKHWILDESGYVCSNQGRADGAEKMFAGAGRQREGTGPDHTSTLGTINNLGNLHAYLRVDKADAMYLRALHGCEKALGQEAVKKYIHIDTYSPEHS